MEVGAVEGHEFDFQAMFDRVNHPARGRQGGADGASTTIARSDGAAMKGKGKQFVPHGARVLLAFPGGAGFGDRSRRNKDSIKRDLARGYISAEAAQRDYGLSAEDVVAVERAVRNGDAL
jgi:N-methylhydantoinase B